MRYPDVTVVATQDEVLHDPALQLVLSSEIANERAPIGVRAMKAKRFSEQTSQALPRCEQLAEVRKTIAATGRIYAIMYSERLEVKAAVKAGELVKAGAIGNVIQTVNIAPHQINQSQTATPAVRVEAAVVLTGSGKTCSSVASSQTSVPTRSTSFLYYTGSTKAEVVASQIANVRHHDHPQFQDFGDMMLRGNNGFGYVRLDWFTPYGLGTWGDGRLFILGTNGYIEVRKYTNVAVSKQGNNLFIVDAKEARYIDCNNLQLPFGPQFVADIVNRTHVAQDQQECLLAAELSIKAQMHATHVTLDWEKA